MRECEKICSMSSLAVEHSLRFLVEAGDRFCLSIGGILKKVQIGEKRLHGTYAAFVRVTDVDGDRARYHDPVFLTVVYDPFKVFDLLTRLVRRIA
jgi:hypothetical protein